MGGFLYFFLFVNKARGWLENVYVGDLGPYPFGIYTLWLMFSIAVILLRDKDKETGHSQITGSWKLQIFWHTSER